jgi:two-component system, OmpR family, alkaline phosphatase synthesis response regulator PhoP
MLSTNLPGFGKKQPLSDIAMSTHPAKRVLVVDDEQDILDLIRYNLAKEGYEVSTAKNGKEALEHAPGKTDLIVLDLMMPVMDGLEVCRRLKQDPKTSAIPIIFLTARSSEKDEIEALDTGADDYLQKPISPRKLVARVRAVFRRQDSGRDEEQEPSSIVAGPLEIDRSTYTVRQSGTEIFLPRKEFEILALLASHPGKVYSREMLLNRIWGNDVVVVDRTVDVHIRKIREKLGGDEDLVETIKGVGYRFRGAAGRTATK